MPMNHRSAGSSRKPFMLFVAPVAPHTSAKGALPPQARTNTAYPADRHGSLYAGDSSVSATCHAHTVACVLPRLLGL